MNTYEIVINTSTCSALGFVIWDRTMQGCGPARKAYGEQGLAANAIDQQCRKGGAEQAGSRRDQPVAQRHVERKLEHGPVNRWHPDREAVVHEIGREPDQPDDERSAEIDRTEQIGQ